MTLAEMADYVCTKVGQTDDESVAVCKKFLDRRYRMIWDAALWKDTKVMAAVTNDTGDFSQVFMPASIERVLQIRSRGASAEGALTRVDYMDPGTIFDYDAALFDRAGQETTFIHLPSLAHPATLSNQPAISFTPQPPLAGIPEPYLGLTVYVKGRQANLNQTVSETLTLGLVGQEVSTQTYFDEVYTISKPLTAGYVYTNIGNLAPDETTAPQYARVKLLPAPTVPHYLLVVGKRRYDPFRADGDTTAIGGIENALLAFAQADMLERQRQYAKAAAKTQEGQALLQQLLELERVQTAYEVRVVPWG
jgi:hypothetical protein